MKKKKIVLIHGKNKKSPFDSKKQAKLLGRANVWKKCSDNNPDERTIITISPSGKVIAKNIKEKPVISDKKVLFRKKKKKKKGDDSTISPGPGVVSQENNNGDS